MIAGLAFGATVVVVISVGVLPIPTNVAAGALALVFVCVPLITVATDRLSYRDILIVPNLFPIIEQIA